MRLKLGEETVRVKKGQKIKIVKGKVKIIKEKRKTKPCQICKKAMYVAKNQVAYYHGKCRKLRNQE